MSKIVASWYAKNPLWNLLKPLAWLYQTVCYFRRQKLSKEAVKLSVPVIIVGNITLGGTGKTPLVIYLANALQEQGFKPGIISRGYASQAKSFPYLVTETSLVEEAGDEPYLIAKNTRCRVIIDPKRPRGAQALIDDHGCDVIISDDGLQHYALARDVEIVVIDGKRGLGNENCLPAGPLREPPLRLKEVDFVVMNGEDSKGHFAHYQPITMHLKPGQCTCLLTNKTVDIKGKTVHAVAGIGNPQRFFDTLRELGADVIEHAFPDHYTYFPEDLRFEGDHLIVMTEKDAVKCQAFANDKMAFISVKAHLSPGLLPGVVTSLRRLATELQSA